ncbi:MAG: replicative DNA helicase [Ignavibacteriaceae bacterium]|nr:replicative DNA helicase [Ignavibacteriaceae bacterium]
MKTKKDITSIIKKEEEAKLNLVNFIPNTIKPPSAVEVEMNILGALMIDEAAMHKTASLLTKDSFYKPAHQIIFEVMLSLYAKKEAIDVVTVYEELEKTGKVESIGGATYLSSMTQTISSAANLDSYIKIIIEKKVLRDVINTCFQVASVAYSGETDALDVLDYAGQKIFDISENRLRKSFIDMKSAVTQTIEYIEAVHNRDRVHFCAPTGFYDLDELLGGGFQNSDLIILAARPSMGKTALALSFARNAAVDFKLPVAFFSLEMATTQLVTRLICAEGRINAQDVRRGKLAAAESQKMVQNAARLAHAQLFMDDQPAQTILEIRAKARRLKSEHKIRLVVVDYLQLMQGPPGMESREREISTISRSLKALAKELEIPIIALSQLNRNPDNRTDKRPQLADLRESGAIEQDADVVMFINRPEYYKQEKFPDGTSTQGIAEIIIAKQRNGPTDEVKLRFVHEYGKFENLERFNKYGGPSEEVF